MLQAPFEPDTLTFVKDTQAGAHSGDPATQTGATHTQSGAQFAKHLIRCQKTFRQVTLSHWVKLVTFSQVSNYLVI